MEAVTLPWVEEFRFATLRFTMVSARDVRFNYGEEDLGGLLRDRFGAALKHSVCPFPNGPCEKTCICPLPCAFHILFAKKRAVGAAGGQDPLRPYVVQPPLPPVRELLAGQPLIFRMVLIGSGVDYWPFVIAAVRRMAGYGIGEGAARWELRQVDQLMRDDAASPVEHLTHCEDPGSHVIPLYDGKADQFIAGIRVETLVDLAPRTDHLDRDRVMVHFLTPTLPRGLDWDRPDRFAPSLGRAILTRWLSLCRDCCGSSADLSMDMSTVATLLARTISVKRQDAGWEELSRISARGAKKIVNRGFVGSWELRGDLGILIPLLAIAERVQIGKGATTGFGRMNRGLKVSVALVQGLGRLTRSKDGVVR